MGFNFIRNVVLLVLCGWYPCTLAAQPVLTARTGKPIVVGIGRALFPVNESDYRTVTSKRAGEPGFVSLIRLPENRTSEALFGSDLVFGGYNRSWMLDRLADSTFLFTGDFDANGLLESGESIQLESNGSVFAGLYRTERTDTSSGISTTYPFLLKVELLDVSRPGSSEKIRILAYRTRQLREGQFEIDGKRFRFGLVGTEGRFDGPNDAVYVDTNGDGLLDMNAENDAAAPASTERFLVDGHVTLAGRTFALDVDPFGRTVALKPEVDSRSGGLAPGLPAPDISFQDLEGRLIRLSDLRGRVVLLDFWGLWCAPCIAQIPQLSAAREALAPLGLEVISINVGDEAPDVSRFVRDHEMNWIHTLEEQGGELQRQFQVRAFPTYLVIGRDGTVLATGSDKEKTLIDWLTPLVKG